MAELTAAHAKGDAVRPRGRTVTTLAFLAAGGALAALESAGRAGAADMPLKAPAPAAASDWGGAYIGHHFLWGMSHLHAATDPAPGQAFALPVVPSAGMVAGLQIGRNWQLPNNLVLGAEADISFVDYFGTRVATDVVSGQQSALTSN